MFKGKVSVQKFFVHSGAVVVSALALAACGGGGGSSTPAPPSPDQEVLTLLNANGGTYQLVKGLGSAEQNGYAVYENAQGQFVAYNVLAFSQGMTLSQFLSATTTYSNLTHGIEQVEVDVPDTMNCGDDGTDACGNAYSYYQPTDIYTDPSSHLVFEEGDQSSKDLEAVSAAVEQTANANVRDMLVSTYGLSQDRAADVASLAQSWKSISQSRTMTTKDLSEFQTKVFGTDLNTISKAAAQAQSGNSASYDALISKAANLNGISPEQTRAIMQGFIQ